MNIISFLEIEHHLVLVSQLLEMKRMYQIIDHITTKVHFHFVLQEIKKFAEAILLLPHQLLTSIKKYMKIVQLFHILKMKLTVILHQVYLYLCSKVLIFQFYLLFCQFFSFSTHQNKQNKFLFKTVMEV